MGVGGVFRWGLEGGGGGGLDSIACLKGIPDAILWWLRIHVACASSTGDFGFTVTLFDSAFISLSLSNESK